MKMKDLPLCPDCAALPPSTLAPRDTFNEVQHLRTAEAVLAIDVETTEHRHVIEESDLVALYVVPKATPLSCSNPHSATHMDGLVARARCGRTFRMGRDCAEQLIENYAQIDRVAAKAREYNAFLSWVKGELEALRVRADAALVSNRALLGFRALLERDLPWFVSEVGRRRGVVFPGVELFDEQRKEITRRLGDLRELEWERPVWEAKLPPLSAQRVIRERLATVALSLDDHEAWARVAARATTRAGFDAALEMVDSDDVLVDVEEFDTRTGEVRTRRREQRRRVRVRARVTDDGIVDEVSGRTVYVAWSR